MTAPFEHANEVRDALRAIVADPALGPESLANAQIAANLLRDLLPDAPGEASLLLAAIDAGSPSMLQEHVAQRMAGNAAISLTAAALASQTAFTPEACQWVVTELAVALGLVPGVPAGQIAPHPATEVRAETSGPPVQEPTITPGPGPGPRRSPRSSGQNPPGYNQDRVGARTRCSQRPVLCWRPQLLLACTRPCRDRSRIMAARPADGRAARQRAR